MHPVHYAAHGVGNTKVLTKILILNLFRYQNDLE